ncbi:MAG: DUF4190 domain-containing protein [Phycisphaeraceae bacterium]
MSQSPPPYSPAPAVGETSGKAIAALIVSCLGIFSSCGLLGIVGIILGNQALSEIRASQGRLTGDGLAKAGVIIGWIGVALVILAMLMFCLWFGFVGLLAAGSA